MRNDLDAVTLAYTTAMREPFEHLRQAAGQLAGVMVLAVASKAGAAGHPMLDLARAAWAQAIESVRSMRPPPRGAHHHRHLTLAARDIGDALDAVRLHLRGADDAATDVVMGRLRQGFEELRHAAAALPGFEMVGFAQGCCARHPIRSDAQ